MDFKELVSDMTANICKKAYTSKMNAIPAPFSLVINVFLKLVIGPYRYEELVFNR
jgi:hypothetical protein